MTRSGQSSQAVNSWTWIDYLEVLTDGATEYRWGGHARIRDMKAAEQKRIVVLEEEHAERDVHPSDRRTRSRERRRRHDLVLRTISR